MDDACLGPGPLTCHLAGTRLCRSWSCRRRRCPAQAPALQRRVGRRAYEELDLLSDAGNEGQVEAEDLRRGLLVAPRPLEQLDVRGGRLGRGRRRRVVSVPGRHLRVYPSRLGLGSRYSAGKSGSGVWREVGAPSRANRGKLAVFLFFCVCRTSAKLG